MRRSLMFFTSALLAFVGHAADVMPQPFSQNTGRAIYKRLEEPNLAFGEMAPPAFVRYSPTGALEVFTCPVAIAIRLYPFHSDMGGSIGIGQCEKTPFLDERYAERQKAYEGKAGFNFEGLPAGLREKMKPQIVQEAGTKFVLLHQFIVAGGGGVLVSTVLAIPSTGSRIAFVQGVLPENACLEKRKLRLCDEIAATWRDLAKIALTDVQGAR